jgi:hypothetical protein
MSGLFLNIDLFNKHLLSPSFEHRTVLNTVDNSGQEDRSVSSLVNYKRGSLCWSLFELFLFRIKRRAVQWKHKVLVYISINGSNDVYKERESVNDVGIEGQE